MRITITIIMVVFNGEHEIEDTILSTINQSYKNIESIIIDGRSTDNTIKIVKKYEKFIDYWESEQDNGIYDAMNKGLKKATGDFVIFMNAGDSFYDNLVLENVCKQITDKNKTYFGRASIKNNNHSWLYPNAKFNSDNIEIWLKKELPNHQAMFFPKIFYKKELYDLNFKIGSDSDYKYKSYYKTGYIFLDMIICNFQLDGVSSSFNSWKHTRRILSDSWKISIRHKSLFYAINRQIRIFSKYLINNTFGNKVFRMFHNKIRN